MMKAISAKICTKNTVDLDMFLSVGYNRNVENCLLRVMAVFVMSIGGSHENGNP